MNKTPVILVVAIVVIVVVGAGIVLVFPSFTNAPGLGSIATTTPTITVGTDAKNATYSIDGVPVTLVNGVSVVPAAPGSASNVTTRYFGNEVVHDLNGDGRPDTAFILTQDSGGSGTFYYAVAALNTARGYVGSQGYLLGDRIAPQATTMGTGTIVIFNYADRKPTDSFATPPSIGKSVWLKLDPTTMRFGVVAQNFEGEANPSTMTLGMKKWSWVNTLYSDGTTVVPHVANKFTLSFSGTNTFSAATDCNGVGGEYTKNGSTITFSRMMSNLMYCANSQEADYAKMFSQVKSYHFTSKGEQVLPLIQLRIISQYPNCNNHYIEVTVSK